MYLQLTDKDILADIREFQKRIQTARDKLAALPEGHLPRKDHKKREKQRLELSTEVKHCTALIGYAEEGLELIKYERRKNHESRIAQAAFHN